MAKKNDKKDLLAFLQGRYGLNNPAEDEVTSSDIKALNLNNPGSFTNYYEDDEDDEELDEWCGFSDLDEMVITDESEDDILEQSELDEIGLFSERVKRTKVIRKGKRVIKWKTNRPGFRVTNTGGRVREVKMGPRERMQRKRQQRIGARKRKRTSRISQLKRKRSIRRRTF
tara:strand:+ start:112 stop:624 length:513 start_codon:yes stop_codon:yes gene_type:complete